MAWPLALAGWWTWPTRQCKIRLTVSLKDDTEQGGDGAGGGNNSGSGAEENSNAAAAAMQPVEDMNDHAIRGDTFATRAEEKRAEAEAAAEGIRSEEHTSELQSRSDL